MGQSQPFSVANDDAWLSDLVDTMERTEQLHDKPCNQVDVAAAMARLQRPANMRRAVVRRGKFSELAF